MRAEPITAPIAELGVNPVWWSRSAQLRLVDAASGEILTLAGEQVTRTPGTAIALRPRLGGGAVVIRRADIAVSNFDDLSDLAGICPLTCADPQFAVECDPDGELWLSTDASGLHQLSVGSLHPRRTSRLTATALAFSADATTLYVADLSGAVFAFDYDPISGLSRQREFLAATGPVRGLCVDADGGVWTARADSGRVVRHSPSGSTTTVVEIATPQVTGCCFGGHGQRTLFITSSATDHRDRNPSAGAVFAAMPGVPGVPSFGFAG